MSDGIYMARALGLAERGRGRTSPNPMVGALVVDEDGAVIGRGAHEVAGGPHAEVFALEDAGARARGATLYCTLEPCSHVGRTGPCAPRVVLAGIRRVVVASEDPNPLVAGRGLAFLRAHGLDVEVGVLRAEAERLNRPFYTRMRRNRPFVTLKAALSSDGCVSAGLGMRTLLTGAAANRLVHRERAEVDAIAIGSGTVLADDPLLTARGVYRYRPLTRVIFDRRLRTPPTARLFSTLAAGPVVIVTDPGGPERYGDRIRPLIAAGARLEVVESRDTDAYLGEALQRLAAEGILSLVVEGGPMLHRSFWAAGLVDRVQLFVAPVECRGLRWDALPVGSIAGLVERNVVPVGEDTLIEGYVHRID